MACSRCLFQRLLISRGILFNRACTVRSKFTKTDHEETASLDKETEKVNGPKTGMKKNSPASKSASKKSPGSETDTNASKPTKETWKKIDASEIKFSSNKKDSDIKNKKADGDKKVAKNPSETKNDNETETDKTQNEFMKPLDYVMNVPIFMDIDSPAEPDPDFKQFVEKMSVRTLPSVGTVISNTQSPKSLFFLKRWQDKMVQELGEEGFKEYKEDTFRQGINFHANIQEFLSGKDPADIQIDPSNEGHWKSLKRVFPQISNIVAVEDPVVHPSLFYKGVFDCVAVYKDSLCLIDWKTSKQPKPLLSNTYDNPLQIAAYIGAVNSSQVLADKGVGIIKSGVLVIAYPKGYPAHIHFMNEATCKEYWQKWQERLHLYWKKQADKKFGLNGTFDEDAAKNYTEFS